MDCSRISAVLLALCFVSHIPRLTRGECNDICVSKCPRIPVFTPTEESSETCKTECAWLCGSTENCDATDVITMREGCFYNSLLSYIDDDITQCSQLAVPPVSLRDPMPTCFNLTNEGTLISTKVLHVPKYQVKSCLLERISGVSSVDNAPLLQWMRSCTWETFLNNLTLINAAYDLQFPDTMNSHCAIRRLLCGDFLNSGPVDPSMFDNAMRAKWSSSLAWICLGMPKPQDGDTVIIPEDVWLLVDESTPALKDIVVHGVLELDPEKEGIVLTAEHITIKNGSLVAGSESSPFQGQAKVIIKGNAAAANGNAGDAAGIGVYGQISIHAAIPSPVHVQLKETASAGTTTAVLSKQVNWKVGDKVILSTTTYGPEDTEVNEVTHIDDGSTLSLKTKLAKSHTAVSLDVESSSVNMSGIVGVLSRRVTFEFTDSFSSNDANAWIYVGKMADSVQGKVHIAGAAFSFPSNDNQPKALFADIKAKVTLEGNAFTHASGGTLCLQGDTCIVQNNLIYNTQLFGIRVEGKSCTIADNLVMMSPSNPDLNVYADAASIDIVNISNIVRGNKVAGFKRVAYRLPETPCGTATPEPKNEANGGLYGMFVNKPSTGECISVSKMHLWKCWNSAIYIMTDANVEISNVILADNIVGITTMLYNVTDGIITIQNSIMIGSSSAENCDDTAPTGFSPGQVNNPPHSGGRAGILWPVFTRSPYVDGRQVNYSVANGNMSVTGVSFVNFGSPCADKTSVFLTNPTSEDFQHNVVVSDAKTKDATNRVYMLPDKNLGSCGEIECDGPKTTILHDTGNFLASPGHSVLPTPTGSWPNESLVPRSVYVLGNGTQLDLKSLIPNYGYRMADCTELKGANAISCPSDKMALLSVRATDFDFLHRFKTPVAFHGNGYLKLLSGPPLYKMADCQAECNLNISWYRIPVQPGSCYNLNYRTLPPQRLRFHLATGASSGVTVAIFYSKLLKFQERIDGAAATNIIESKTASCQADRSEFNLVTRKLYVAVQPGKTVDIFVQLTVSFVFVAKNVTEPLTVESVKAAVAKQLNITVESIRVRIDHPVSRSTSNPSVYVDILIQQTGTADPDAEGITSEEDFLAYAKVKQLSQELVDSVLTGVLAKELGIEMADIMMFESLPPAGSDEWKGMTIQEVVLIDSPFLGGIHSLKIVTFPGQVTAGKAFKTFIIATDANGKCVDASRGDWKVTAVLKNAKGKPVALLRGTVKVPFKSCWANFTNILITTAGSGYSLEFIVMNNQQFFTLSKPFVVEEDRGSFARNIAIYVMEGVAGALAFATVGTIGICHRRKQSRQEV